MSYECIEVATIEEARSIASTGGRYLVVDPETMQQVEEAEASGGYEGGKTGNADGSPYSASGTGDVTSSSEGDSEPVDEIDLDGAWVLRKSMTIDDGIEHAMDLSNIIETWLGKMTGPVILVPKRELDRWLGVPDPGDGA